MGYILPVTHFTYKNYQNRMMEQKRSPHFVGEVYKIKFHEISSEYEDESDIDDVFQWEEYQKEEDRLMSDLDPYYIPSGAKAELTGKGGHINAQI